MDVGLRAIIISVKKVSIAHSKDTTKWEMQYDKYFKGMVWVSIAHSKDTTKIRSWQQWILKIVSIAHSKDTTLLSRLEKRKKI